jgi:serine protease Do
VAAAAAPAPAAAARAAASSTAAPRPGIVRLERAGHRIGFGVVLRADGRILTSLAAIGSGNYVKARFSDDHVLGVKVVETDRTWDLALLAPEGGFWTEGVRASSVDASAEGVRLRRFGGRGKDVSESAVVVKARQVLLGRDGATLEDALVLGSGVPDDELGSPICDDAGDVVALVGQACDPGTRQDCRMSAFGIPVSAIKQFLRAAPSREPLPAAWLGFRGVPGHSGSVGGVRVIAVDAGSPAEQAGLRAPSGKAGDESADLVVAVNDSPVATPDELRDAVNRIALSGAGRSAAAPPLPATPGDAKSADAKAGDAKSADAKPSEPTVRLLVYGTGKFRELDLPLRAPVTLPASP